MKKLITLTAALLMTTQVFALNDPLEGHFNGQDKCFSFEGRTNSNTSIEVTSKDLGLDNVDVIVKSLGKGKDGKWTPFGDQDWHIKLSYTGPAGNIPFTVNVNDVAATSKGEGPNFNHKNCDEF